MSIHKLSAGHGYTYLTRQVAAVDATHLGHTSLGDFYTAKGESPGRWVGAGLSGLDGVDAGDPVSAEQMKALFGEGRHPNADTIGTAMIRSGCSPARALHASTLGKPFRINKKTLPLRVEVARRLAQHNHGLGLAGNAPIPAELRTQICTDVGAEMFRDWHGRPPVGERELNAFITKASHKPSAVAGYDLSFSPVKSVSSLWALATPEVASAIQQAHLAAVASTLGWLERDATFTRARARGVRHIEVSGLIAASFTHRDSRSGNPDLHTHVAVSNKVQTLGGAWMALDGRFPFKAHVAASERYDTRIEAELIARLGVRFEPRRVAVNAFERPIRELVGIDAALNTFWSSRRAARVVPRDPQQGRFQVDRGRRPTSADFYRLSEQAILGTRPAKHSPRSYADQRAAWAAEARQVLGGDHAVETMLTSATGSHQRHQRVTGQPVTRAWVGTATAAVVARVSLTRPTWQVWHVRAEAERVAKTTGVLLADLDVAVDLVVASAMSPEHAFLLRRPVVGSDPGIARRRDGSSVYSVPGGARFASRAFIDAQRQPVADPGKDWPDAAIGVFPADPAHDLARNLAQPAAQISAPDRRPQMGFVLPWPARGEAIPPGSGPEPSQKPGSEPEAGGEALFHAATQREYSPAADLDSLETERQLVEANRWDHALVSRARLIELNELAADFFLAAYPASWGPAYVSSRLRTDLSDHPGLRPGFAPAGWTHLTQHLRALGAGDEEILATGLGRVASTGAIIDQFRDRLVLPIRNGEVICGFIGRANPGRDDGKAGPKYLNTARTDLFDKGAQLFGLTEGRTALEAGATPVLAEGFFDAVAVTVAAGGAYVGLACLGTSFTTAQANQLRPYIGAGRPGIAVATDADRPGQIAADRAFWMLTARGDTPRHVLLAGGQDPAEVLELGGSAVLLACLQDAPPLGRRLLDQRLANIGEDLRALTECAIVIAAQPAGTWVEQIDYVADRTGAGRHALAEEVAGAAQRWTLDPLGSAQAQIGALWGVRARLEGAAGMRLASGEPADLAKAEVVTRTRPDQGPPESVSPEARAHLETRPSRRQAGRPAG
jgi:hypothetical protein